ncbi:MAG: glycoside hydrolase family 127 protein [Bacteroidetes bacterium]|nr:glycoside hydrolase family 127 protein [Bacteroidota bacterium]
MKKWIIAIVFLGAGVCGRAQRHAVLARVDMGAVRWTKGFWAERFEVCRDSMLPNLWTIYTDAKVSHAFENFRIAAGLDTGSHSGPPFHDGDFYKLLEGMAATYAVTKDRRLDSMMDMAIAVIVKCQRSDGYIHTPTIIEERKHPGRSTAFEDRLNFETYNMGHLMTAACVHYKATGKRTLLDAAIKAANYLEAFYRRSSPELARNAICPSHYMGLVDLYRTTGDAGYLSLAKNLIGIRGLVSNGTDDNQDRIPFHDQYTAMGHAVRANYLYAGVADVVAEAGDDSLRRNLDSIWKDVTERKLYITGGCGALYDGVSPDAVSYSPPDIQEVHQAYGRAYQLPNETAHNETCANIGNVLWNWRMLVLTGQAKYADVMEEALYNSVLSGVDLNGGRWFYTNPLRVAQAFPYALRWSGGRVPYIKLSNCCPPNLARTIAEVSGYAYSVNGEGVWVNLYGGNKLETAKAGIEQVTDYPWSGRVKLVVKRLEGALFLRIPGWCHGAVVTVNGKLFAAGLEGGKYVEVRRGWKAGDVVEVDMPMAAVLVEANPLVEEDRGQVAVRRGPIVYCLESADMPAGASVFRVAVPVGADLVPVEMRMGNSRMMGLEGNLRLLPAAGEGLYREVPKEPGKMVRVRLVPYYAWDNRGQGDMTVWMNVSR